jgi:outer membrane lipoprotein-sorting protein
MTTKMKCLTMAILSLASLQGLFAQGLSADEIIRKADEKSRGLSSQGSMTMTVVRPDWTRTITMKVWSKSREYSLVLITAPSRDKGPFHR